MADTPKQFLHLTPDKCVTVHYKTKKIYHWEQCDQIGRFIGLWASF